MCEVSTQVLLDYLHSGCCPLSCITIPGLICAAEHYDLPDLIQVTDPAAADLPPARPASTTPSSSYAQRLLAR